MGTGGNFPTCQNPLPAGRVAWVSAVFFSLKLFCPPLLSPPTTSFLLWLVMPHTQPSVFWQLPQIGDSLATYCHWRGAFFNLFFFHFLCGSFRVILHPQSPHILPILGSSELAVWATTFPTNPTFLQPYIDDAALCFSLLNSPVATCDPLSCFSMHRSVRPSHLSVCHGCMAMPPHAQ
jgi:hypothetical protein